MVNIKFGTDGWRAEIAKEFNFDNVTRVGAAIADYVKQTQKGKPLLIGYDTRFLSKEFAERIAEVAAGRSVKVLLTPRFVSTPEISFAAREKKTAGAVMITASHNPYAYNGIKFKGNFGGPGTPDMIAAIEKQLHEVFQAEGEIKQVPLEEGLKKKSITLFDPEPSYLRAVEKLVDLSAIRRSKPRVVIDAMHGAAIGRVEAILRKIGVRPVLIRHEFNPSFGGVRPEPTADNLEPLSKAVRKHGAQVGLATDGDGDRIGVVDARGRWVTTQEAIALLLTHLVKNRGMTGEVAKAISTTEMLDALCEQYELFLHTTPVGFKSICELMLTRDILLGGEESGGYGIKGHIPERDGILCSLLFLEMMAMTRKSMAVLVKDLFKTVGYHTFVRSDQHLTEATKARILKKLHERPPTGFARYDVIRVNTIDGWKFNLSGGHWVLIRASGTEPLVRIYVEARSDSAAQRILRDVRRQLIGK